MFLIRQLSRVIAAGSFRTGVLCLLSLFLVASSPVSAGADVAISLNMPDSAAPGGAVQVSGGISGGGTVAGVPLGITVNDPGNNTYFIDQTTSAADGSFSFHFRLPSDAQPGGWRVSVAGGGATAGRTLTVAAGSSSSGGGGGGAASPQAVTSTTGSATVDPAAGGVIGLGSDASLSIPPGALAGEAAVDVEVRLDDSPPAVPADLDLLCSVYEFKVDGQDTYSFNKQVTLTFGFDRSRLPASAAPAVYGYDQASSQWGWMGGVVSGSSITVRIDRLTRFGVMAVRKTPAATGSGKFSDVPASYWAGGIIDSLSGLGCISGYPDGSFRPAGGITRAEFIAIVAKALKLPAYDAGEQEFSDVSRQDWYYRPVESAVHSGIARGDGGVFRPDDPVTREQAACILVQALGRPDASLSESGESGFMDDASISGWAKGFVAVAVQRGLIKGYPEDNSFRPQHGATRAEACAMIDSFLGALK